MAESHGVIATREWYGLVRQKASKGLITLDGAKLTISEVIAVSIYEAEPSITTDSSLAEKVQRSVTFLEQELDAGRTIYGVTTGFGGSADTRTARSEQLQVALQQLLNVGILRSSDKGLADTTSDIGDLRSHALPSSVVKAMMLIRTNSLLQGHSGVRISVLDAILDLVRQGLTPVVPLRGSISASGDLAPLSYITGVLEGNPDINVQIMKRSERQYMPADRALQYAGLQPIKLGPKEGLGLTNGTSTSCAVACIAIHQADQIAMLVQLLTAMSTEALLGTTHNYHPFISAVRPHSGQVEASANIRALLSGSQLAPDSDPQSTGLAQDRYALRTAPQWIGPQLEDLSLARRQVEIELNSVSDNPLIDATHGNIHHGGNFQAASLTSAMEKARMAVQMLGRLVYAQFSEMVDNKLSDGLPPNLCADDPGLSFTFKGFDINMTAYMSELAYLAHPVSSHVLPAEMNNQHVNSLALVAGRYTLDAIEIACLMTATHLYALCQALDLRCLHLEYIKCASPAIHCIVEEVFASIVAPEHLKLLGNRAWKALLDKWLVLSTSDLISRGPLAAKESLGDLLEAVSQYRSTRAEKPQSDFLEILGQYQARAGETMNETYDRTRSAFFQHQTTCSYLGTGSKILYRYVREHLKVPLCRGLIDHPTLGSLESACRKESNGKILGTYASNIYMSIRKGELHGHVVKAFELADC